MGNIHLTETPLPLSRENAGSISFYGEFNDGDKENDYRAVNLRADTYIAKVVILAVSFMTIPFVINDYVLHGDDSTIFILAGARLFMFSASVAVWFLLSTRKPGLWQNSLFLWTLCLVLHTVYITSTRPAGHVGPVASNLLIVLSCYLIIPIRLQLQTIAAVTISVGHALLFLWIVPINDPVLRNTLLSTFLTANIIGFFSSRQLNYWRRFQYESRRKLSESEKHFRKLVDASGSMVFTMSIDRAMEQANFLWHELTGRSSRLTAKEWLSTFHADDKEQVTNLFETGLETRRNFEMIGRITYRNDIPRWVLTRMVPISDDSGEINKWIGTATDIHDQWTTKMELQETNRQLTESIGRVTQLEEILPICSFCKKIKDENANWLPLDHYITTHSETRFSHGICESCGVTHYGDLGEELFKTAGNS